MKIVHVFKDAYPPLVAGITRYISDLSSEFVQRGHEVDVLVAGVKTRVIDLQADGVRIIRCSELGRALSMPLSPELARTARSIECDVVHLHMPNPIGEWGIARRRDDVPHVATFHAQLGKQRGLAPLYRPLQNAIINRATRVMVSSDALAASPELDGARAAGTLDVLPFGVSPKLIAPDAKGRFAATSLPGPLRVLFVGRLVYYKGIDVLLDALEMVPDAQLTIVGEGVLGDLVRARSSSGPLAGRVRWLHNIDDRGLQAVYASHDVFVLPSVSRAEAFGLAMAEAMANGLAIISTRLNTGTDWVNEEGVSGLVVEPGAVGALAEALRSLRDDSLLRSRLALGAYNRAEKEMSFQRHADAIEAIYTESLGAAAAAAADAASPTQRKRAA